MFIFKGEDN